MHGEGRLTVNSRLPPAEFAFLSACHTEELTDTDDPTMGVSIAAAMQCHGFGSVVGTMLEMAYPDGELVSGVCLRVAAS
ncbi:hypothetical protein EDB89DRAFT_2032745 [Lactarius sanguifluus]|nr:hypothetical protein EDB89DRAFT_2032745 [Lactarius sanguifluus]